MTAVQEREPSVSARAATVPVPRDAGAQDRGERLPARWTAGSGADERDLVTALLVHGYGRRPGDLRAALACLDPRP